MSNFKFKPGDPVEVTSSSEGYIGYRFSISKRKDKDNINIYETDVKSGEVFWEFFWVKENNLKLINPDIDDISEFKLSEILDEVFQAITVEQ